MTPEQWKSIGPILESALAMEPANRVAFLDRVCVEDPFLRREVESLILTHDEAGPALLNPTCAPDPIPGDEAIFRLIPGKRIGAYEIRGEIAIGGMGAVYRAIRADGQYRQHVALKIVRSELGTNLVSSRFKNERQILASLDHPNIARILDGGTAASPIFSLQVIITGEPAAAGLYADFHCHERIHVHAFGKTPIRAQELRRSDRDAQIRAGPCSN